MLDFKRTQKALCPGQGHPESGFSLLEIILVMVLVGIIAAVVGPFLGQVMSNFLDVCQMNERERQATPALERFVRDVRGAEDVDFDSDNDCSQKLEVTKEEEDGESYVLTYEIKDGDNTLTVRKDNGIDQILAKHVGPDSKFCKHSIGKSGSYKLYLLDLRVNIDDGDPLEYSAAAVPHQG